MFANNKSENVVLVNDKDSEQASRSYLANGRGTTKLSENNCRK